MKRDIELQVNGSPYHVTVEPNLTLLQFLREELGLTGTKEGCASGECGACTVLIDGEPVRSCLTLAVDVRGRPVTTIEGVSENGKLNKIQQAFVDLGAIQCGFCTPGMILVAKALLEKIHQPSEREIRKAISGNLCRCTGYVKIVKAIEAASQPWYFVSEKG
ncbi:MAG: 2Fe-2S iron-sulfur cluster binding domain-containing protein [Proteobacteria bacterium]|nr:2Fe-2S iron-sulfur cluster binding domain-containing protein [Pseudomonadota bacterium]